MYTTCIEGILVNSCTQLKNMNESIQIEDASKAG